MLLLVAMGAMIGLNVVADSMVSSGALGGRVNHAADKAIICGGIKVVA